MPLEFTTNTLLQTNHKKRENKISNICYVFPELAKVAVVTRRPGYIGRPEILTAKELRNKITNRTYKIVEDFNEDLAVTDDDNIPEKYRIIRDARYRQISPIIENKSVLERYLLNGTPTYIFEEQMRIHGVTSKHLYNILHRYLAYGGVINALLPRYKACGRSKKVPRSAKDPGKKRGRPPVYSKLNTRNWVREDTVFLEKLWENMKDVSYKSNEDIYIEFCLQRFNMVIARNDAGKYVQAGKSNTEIISLEQFQYHFTLDIHCLDYLRRQKGTSDYENNRKGTAGSARHGVRGSRDLYQIDATTASTNLLYSKSDKVRIPCGRPTLYVVVDVYSTMIVGFYVSMGDPRWTSAAEALFNAFMNKVDFCQEFNVNIKDEEWPCYGVPRRLGMDRDSAHSRGNLEPVLKANFGIEEIEIYPAYEGAAKGITERAIGALERKNKRIIGSRNKNTAVDKPHPSNHALYTYRDYVKAVIRAILDHNNLSHKAHLLDQETVKHAVDASPLAIWNLTKNRSGTRAQPTAEKIRFALLRPGKAVLTGSGVLFRSRYYASSTLRLHFSLSRNLGRDSIDIRYSSATTNYIWFKDEEGTIHHLELSEKSDAFRNATEFEAGMLSEERKHMSAEAEKNRFYGRSENYKEQQADEAGMKKHVRGMKKTDTKAPPKELKHARAVESAEQDAREAQKLIADLNGESVENETEESNCDPFDTGTKLINRLMKEKKL